MVKLALFNCTVAIPLLTVATLLVAPAAVAGGARQAAVAQARLGHVDAAVAALRTMLAQGTKDPLVALDLGVILQQAGRPADALAVFQRVNVATAPSYALLAMTRACRDLQRFDRAEALARQGQRRFPNEPVWIVSRGLILADAGKGTEALAVLASPAAQAAPNEERLLAQGYPFVMAWYWMIGALLFWFGAEQCSRDATRRPQLEVWPPISIVVPCHNEAATVDDTFNVLAAIDYPAYEIVAVNDGSPDNTGVMLDRLAADIPQMRVVHLAANQGKAIAMNVGGLLANHEILVLIDGDALLDPHALRWVAATMRSPQIGGLTGNPRIRNRSSLLGRLQVGEFSSIIGLIKRAQSIYGRLFTVSGVICAFRRRALEDSGWWSPNTLTDDVDITWRMQRAGWRITYVPNIIAWILMPETLRGLWRQRLRWAEGGSHMLHDNARPILGGGTLSLLPVYANAVLGIVWSYCMLGTIMLAALHTAGLRVLPTLPTFSAIPEWYGLTLCFTYLLQSLLSGLRERRFEPGMLRSLFWVIWYPMAFWMLSAATAVLAVPRSLTHPRAQRMTWISPDRGLR